MVQGRDPGSEAVIQVMYELCTFDDTVCEQKMTVCGLPYNCISKWFKMRVGGLSPALYVAEPIQGALTVLAT